MKRGTLKLLIIGLSVMAFPRAVDAGQPADKQASVVYASIVLAIDSIPPNVIQDDKNQKKKEKDAKKQDEKKDDANPKIADVEKPDIKEVPKARPKLRPAAVADKIKVKNLPVKVKPKLMRSIRL